jgi:flagellar motor switch protein FliN
MADDTPKQPAGTPMPDPVAQSPAPDAAAEAALTDAARQVADLGNLASQATGKDAAFQFPAFGAEGSSQDARALDLLGDVNLNVKIELGRTRMLVEDVLRLGAGSVVELDKLAGDPVDIYVNDRFVAKGEVLVLNDNFCVRINEIVKSAPEGEAAASKAG